MKLARPLSVSRERGPTCWFIKVGEIRKVVAGLEYGRVHKRGKLAAGVVLKRGQRCLE